MSATTSNTPQHGTTNLGSTRGARNLDFGPLPLDYKFRGDAENAGKWRYMEETVLNQVLAKEGFKMTWLLLEKQVPDKTMCVNNDGSMTPDNRQKYKAKLDEIEEKRYMIFFFALLLNSYLQLTKNRY